MEVNFNKVANQKWNKAPNESGLSSTVVHPPVSPLSHNYSPVDEMVESKENTHVVFKEGNFLRVQLADSGIGVLLLSVKFVGDVAFAYV